MDAISRPHRRSALKMACGAVLAGLGAPRIRAQIAHETLVLALNALPGPEHAGVYAAEAAGLFRRAGLLLEIRAGEVGPARPGPVDALANGADMVLCHAAELAQLASRNAPLLAVAAFFQKSPRALFCHPGQGLDEIAKIKGRPILVGAQGRGETWPFLKAKFGFADDQLRPYSGNTAPFLADKGMCLEGSVIDELISVESEGGIRPVVHRVSESGLDAYDEVLAISPTMPPERQVLVQKFIEATVAGWASYLGATPESRAVHALIRTANAVHSEEHLASARTAMIERALITGGDARKAGIGTMTDQRWKALAGELVAASLVRADFDIAGAYTLALLNRGSAP
ncbi:MAG: ABC transporter substrate-binding protein [Proteobacteria bacterium]|nr:ABC transporter substrate-binding protein [Pseudomonadota bacterium]